MVEQTVSTFGRLDAAFNNAGVQSPAVETADASGEEFDRVNAINLRGVWNCIKYELRQMREQESGAIVNCSSIGGLIGIAGRATYHASKHGVIGLTKSAALEYASRGIRINAVCPGTIETPMVAEMLAKEPDAMKDIMRDQPIGRLGRTEFNPQVLDALRQPLETGETVIARANDRIALPIAHPAHRPMNPCRCGRAGEPGYVCRQGRACAERYQARISGPMLDRIDLQIEVPAVSAADLVLPQASEGSAEVRALVTEARRIQTERYAALRQLRIRTNAECDGTMLGDRGDSDPGEEHVARIHVAEALIYRGEALRRAQAAA